MVQETGITGVVETISPSPAYWGCIENLMNAPAESRIANKLHTKNHMKFHTILLDELLETLRMVSTLSCLCSQDHVPRADGHYICARADGHARVSLCEGNDIVCSIPDEHHMGLAFGASSETRLLFFLDRPDEISLQLGRAPSNGVARLYPPRMPRKANLLVMWMFWLWTNSKMSNCTLTLCPGVV